MMLRCPVCDQAGDYAFDRGAWNHKRNLDSRRCTNRIRVEQLGPEASALIHHDPDGQKCPGIVVPWRPAIPSDTAKEAA